MRHENNVDTFKMVHGVYVVSCDSSGMDNVIYPNTMEIVPASGEDLKLAKSIAVYLNSPINDVEMPTKIIVVWWDKITENIDLSHISSLAWDQIGYYALVSKLVHDPAPISTLSIQQLDTDRVWSPLLPEVDLLRAEIANAQDNDVVAAAASQSYLAARPGMEADVEYAAAAAGVIAKLREAVARR
ncbi:MAG: hypothetical protein R3B58_03390 [Phycisphaerales bacterium]